tara:strand:+ start:1333 stop:1569 length:237 start_codon:yes stop_codon:yes gene_type:complete
MNALEKLDDEELHLSGSVYFLANHWELFSSQISIVRDSKYDNQDDIDIGISKDEAVKIIDFLQKHYQLTHTIKKEDER